MITDPDKIERIRSFLGSALWNEDIHPAIRNWGAGAIRALCLSPGERSGDWKNLADEDLRAIIRISEWMVSWMKNEVQIFDYNKQREQLARQMDGIEAGDNLAQPSSL